MMLYKSPLTLLGIGLVLLLGGCGERGTDTSEKANAGSSTPPQSAPPAPRSTTPTPSKPAVQASSIAPLPAPGPRENFTPSAEGRPGMAGVLKIEPGFVDFGVIPPKSVHEATVVLTNTGSGTLEILRSNPSCMCTMTQDLTGVKLPAGQSIAYTSVFNAPTEPGTKEAKVYVTFTHNGEQTNGMIKLGGEITMAITAKPPYVDALKQKTTGHIIVRSRDEKPFTILSSGGQPPIYADGFDPAREPLRNAYKIVWNIEARSVDACGTDMWLWWPIETDHPDCPLLPMRVRHECTGGRADPMRQQRKWTFGEQIATFDEMSPGVPEQATIKIVNKESVPITNVRSLDSNSQARLLEARQEGETTFCLVEFTANPGTSGLLYSMVRFDSPTGGHAIGFVGSVR